MQSQAPSAFRQDYARGAVTKRFKVCVIVPTKNEAGTIQQVIRALHGALDPSRYDPPHVIVVDDSSDDTRRLAREAGASVIVGGGRGLGAAMFDGLKTAAALDCDFILSIDGDGQADVSELPRFVEPLERGQADLVLASRFQQQGLVKYHYRLINSFGTRVLVSMLRRFTGLALTDSHGGIRAMRRAVAAELEMLGNHTYVQETIIDAVEKGFRVVEIPSVWKAREHGTSRVVSSIPRYVFYTLPVLMLRSGQHIRLLYSGGLALILVALAYFFTILAQVSFNVKATGDRVPAFVWITLMISLGFQFFFFGLILQLVKQMKHKIDRIGQRTDSRPDINAGLEVDGSAREDACR
jgi:glycosyltransferase involved in cell wall biosynthesis